MITSTACRLPSPKNLDELHKVQFTGISLILKVANARLHLVCRPRAARPPSGVPESHSDPARTLRVLRLDHDPQASATRIKGQKRAGISPTPRFAMIQFFLSGNSHMRSRRIPNTTLTT